jgi:RNA polymerase sigma factor for flagellar operon FliA
MLDDLVSHGREGLLGAARSFDPGYGVPFRRWANFRVKGAMLDGVRAASMLPRSVYERLRAVEAAHHASEGLAEEGSARPPGSAEEADARLTAYLASIATAVAVGLLATPTDGSKESLDPTAPADEQLARAEVLAEVRAAMEELPEQERHLVQRHYLDDVRLDEAANEIGLSKSWGSRLHTRAIEGITRHMKRAKVAL